MANLPNDELPSKFDVVVDGTGLIQSILSAAIVRAGKSVLHLDRNGHYGEHWGSFMHRELKNWMSGDPVESPDPLLSLNDGIIAIPSTVADPVSNLIEVIPPTPDTECSPGTKPVPEDSDTVNSTKHTHAGDNSEEIISPIATKIESTDESTDDQALGAEASDPTMPDDHSTGSNEQGLPITDEDAHTTGYIAPAEDKTTPTVSKEQHSVSDQMSPPVLTWESMERQWRSFSFDLIPKVLYCRGAMVELLTQSNCSRYTEFKAVGKVYRVCEGCVEQVPCSRADLFSSQAVSMLEKRRMMKFLSFSSDYTSHPEAFQEFQDAPFEKFLQSRGLPEKVIDYIAHSIAMVGRAAPTIQALEATKVFLTSLGRFGNAPFLYPIFGVGELGQAFCRLCAVYGGVYCLRRWVVGVDVTQDRVSAVVCSTGQRIETSTLICSARYVRDTLKVSEHVRDEVISRAMVVTDGPLPGTDGKVAVITVPPLSVGPTQTHPVSVLQLDPSSNCSAPNTYLLHFVCPSSGATAQTDLEPVIKTLLERESGPRVLWSLYFNLSLCLVTGPVSSVLGGVYVTSDPDTSLNYEGAVKEARRIFEEVCPGEEFLPTPPDPKDIVYDTPTTEDANTEPGHTDNAEPGHTDNAEPGHTDNTEPGHTDNTEPGHTDNAEHGHTDNTEPGHTDNTEPGHTDNTERGHTDNTAGTSVEDKSSTKQCSTDDDPCSSA